MDNQRGTRLLYSCMNMRKQLNKLTNSGELSQGEYQVLRCIRQKSSGRTTDEYMQSIKASELSELLGLSRSSITQILNSLEKREFISRTIDKKDRRSIFIELTGKGTEALNKANTALVGISGKLALALGDSDTEKLIELLDKLAEIYKSIQRENGGQNDE